METKFILAFVLVILVLFFVSKSAMQFVKITFSLVFITGAIGIFIVHGFTMESVIGLVVAGFVTLFGWFRMKNSFADTAMARASFDRKLTQKRYSRCNVCGKKLSYHRMPKNFNQLFFGGLTCKNCGAEFDIPYDEFVS